MENIVLQRALKFHINMQKKFDICSISACGQKNRSGVTWLSFRCVEANTKSNEEGNLLCPLDSDDSDVHLFLCREMKLKIQK